ncbi:MAG: nucleotidyltransferase domain-containing protein [Salinivenus sp.]
MSNPSTVDPISREQVRDVVVPTLRPYATRIELFGSVARGESTETSDIDLLLTLRAPENRPPLGLRWFELEQELSEQLGRPVELVTQRALSPHLRPHVTSDRVTLYEDE